MASSRAAVISRPGYHERLLFMGTNGSGKSELAKAMLSTGYSYVAFDSKGDFDMPGKPRIIRTPEDWHWRFVPPQVIYRPEARYNTPAWNNEMLRRMYIRAQKSGKKRPFIVYVDEALQLSQSGHTHWLSALAVSGRSLGVGLWCASQRPKWIPVSVKTEAWRWYVFFLAMVDDDREVEKFSKGQVSAEELQAPTVDHSFWELKRGPGGRILVRKYPPIDPARTWARAEEA